MALVTDRDKCAHLLRRFGLGASQAELDYYLRDGLHGAVDLLLDDSGDDGFTLDPYQFDNAKGQLPMPIAVNWWVLRMIMTRKPLREKMCLFWHDHFATSAEKVTASRMMLQQNDILRRNALGNFKTMLSEVSKDPAMIVWLDNQTNTKAHANENFAREVMELFTLGIGHYTEVDVKQGARAFTGWSLRRNTVQGEKGSAEFLFRPFQHDNGDKTFLGHTGNLSGDDVLDILCAEPRTSEYLVTKLWDWFVWPKPDAATIAPFARRFHDGGMDIKGLLRDIMLSSEFYSEKAERKIVKTPVDYCVATMRQLGVGEILAERQTQLAANGTTTPPRGLLAPAQAAVLTMKGMGMWLMYPPDVSGWKTGDYWITSATMVERIAWGERLFGQGKVGKIQLRYPSYRLLAADRTPQRIVERLITIFDAPVKANKAGMIATLAEKSMPAGLTQENAGEAAGAIAKLIFATPEYQFA